MTNVTIIMFLFLGGSKTGSIVETPFFKLQLD